MLAKSRLFGEVEEEAFRFWQVVDQHSIRDLVRSRSNIALLSPPEQEAKMAEVLAFYEEYGRGRDGMQLPYTATCFRAQMLDRVAPTLTDDGSAEDGEQPRLRRLVDRHAAHRLPLEASTTGV